MNKLFETASEICFILAIALFIAQFSGYPGMIFFAVIFALLTVFFGLNTDLPIFNIVYFISPQSTEDESEPEDKLSTGTFE